MSRKRAREVALQALFQLDMTDGRQGAAAEDQALAAAWETGKKPSELDEGYARALVAGTREHLAEIDADLSAVSKEWKVSRMAVIDRNILRLAVYEMRFVPEMTPAIAINEAVELAKRFSSDESPRFVNGVLGSVVRK
ncbi:MAG: transcription antitermination factor NusB [Schwartzia sp.]|nr:transcription antitermination factor NusB [Schwartzia sp. (in: firmicutes)]